ncbi:MAG TPA: rRNA maturation RNase YbeY [Candidatus Baltobacteraceae bacterium]|jgi:probable rRNA maturation factor
MPVALVSRVRSRDLKLTSLRRTAQRLLDAIGYPDAQLSITLVGDAAIRKLNREYRHKDRPTDVLSFPLGDGAGQPLLGDVVISVATAKRQAAEYDATLQRELERLLIHGILHLLGHDHHRRNERLQMEREEKRLARAIGMPWPY